MRHNTFLFHTITVVALVLACVGCGTRVVHVPVETVHYRDRTVVEKDIQYQRDSIYMYVRNDTVFKFVDRIVNHYLTKTDTVRIEKTKDVPYPVEVEKIVKEKYIPWYAKLLTYLGAVTLCFFAVRGIVKKFKWW